jgi:hypothetical protein
MTTTFFANQLSQESFTTTSPKMFYFGGNRFVSNTTVQPMKFDFKTTTNYGKLYSFGK